MYAYSINGIGHKLSDGHLRSDSVCWIFDMKGKPNPSCCRGVKKLASLPSTTPGRRAVCSCLKSFYSQFPNINSVVVSGLRCSCGVNIPFKISLQTNSQYIRSCITYRSAMKKCSKRNRNIKDKQ